MELLNKALAKRTYEKKIERVKEIEKLLAKNSEDLILLNDEKMMLLDEIKVEWQARKYFKIQ